MYDPLHPTSAELAAAQTWWQHHVEGDAWPFSLRLDGRPVESAAGWTVERTEAASAAGRQALHLIARHPDHGLSLHCTAVRYHDFPVVEWTLSLEQGAQGAAPMIADLCGLDATWELSPGQRWFLRSFMGDDHEVRSIYQPCEHELRSGHRHVFAPTSRSGLDADGRPSSGAFPYFVVERVRLHACNERSVEDGFQLAVGWPGRWSAAFALEGGRLRIAAGQERTQLRLKPGETVRAPLIVLSFFQGTDQSRAMNLWRRWMLAHNLPRIGGRPPDPILLSYSGVTYEEMTRATTANQIEAIDLHRTAQLPITHWWMDAGWYPCHVAAVQRNCWPQVGTWEVDRSRFPNGLREISDHAHRQGLQTVLWFEPERVAPGTWLHAQRPQWLLATAGQRVLGADAQPDGDDLWRCSRMFDLGNPEARSWLVERVSDLIRSEGIDLYRQDFNYNPLPYWRDNDPPGRAGMTENRHVSGYLAYWDALRERFPDMLLDSCASGGRRNDLESMRRAVALHPSDHRYDDLEVKQCLRHTLFQWLPYFGGMVVPLDRVDPYAFRSTLGLATAIVYDLRKSLDLDLLRELLRQWHEVAPLFYGDFHPLTACSLADDAWMAWQFHRHEQGDGLIQVFRRAKSPMEEGIFPLRGLDPDAVYQFHDFDQPGEIVHHGAELAAGWRIRIPERRSARLIRYCRQV
jgi:alpha-galactosidase